MERNPFRLWEAEQIGLLCVGPPLCFFRSRRPAVRR